jgi:hypothetical protein
VTRSSDREPFDAERAAQAGHREDTRVRVQVFDASTDERGQWRLDESPGRYRWAAAIKQFLLIALSVAVAATLWVFAFALMLVLLPLVALAAWWMWRRLHSLQRMHRSRRSDAGQA